MKKRMCVHIVLCGLLSSSAVMFGMDQKQPVTPSDNGEAGSTWLHDRLEGLQKADDVVYNVGHEILEDLKGNPQVLVGFMEVGKMQAKNAQATTTTVENVVNLVEIVQDDVHNVIQHIGKK